MSPSNSELAKVIRSTLATFVPQLGISQYLLDNQEAGSGVVGGGPLHEQIPYFKNGTTASNQSISSVADVIQNSTGAFT